LGNCRNILDLRLNRLTVAVLSLESQQQPNSVVPIELIINHSKYVYENDRNHRSYISNISGYVRIVDNFKSLTVPSMIIRVRVSIPRVNG